MNNARSRLYLWQVKKGDPMSRYEQQQRAKDAAALERAARDAARQYIAAVDQTDEERELPPGRDIFGSAVGRMRMPGVDVRDMLVGANQWSLYVAV